MKKYLAVFDYRTLLLLLLSFVSSYTCYHFQLSLYLDFLIVGLLIAFPLTLTIKEAFKRREKALQYLSLFKASLHSVFYSIQNTKLDQEQKSEFRAIATALTDQLSAYLLSESKTNSNEVAAASERVALFINKHKKELKSSLAQKILLFLFRLNESIEFLVATKKHRTPKTLRLIVLFSIFMFTMFYPAGFLKDVGFEVAFWQVFASTAFKSLLLISLYNVQALLEDPFDQRGTDGIQVNNFAFSASDFPPVTKKEKAEKNSIDEEDDLLD
ncbi:MAG TPA: hypothetical protein PKM63_03235 [Panacibacter sp.]|nr:hypothetical protein [Panacibacter sp.]HNP43272.1 hypothetical protein [Panacibacter sp.]